tara:strand:- start:979 stop:1803 length:825 start_codon:yes stop_codon:yes gene_type:complete
MKTIINFCPTGMIPTKSINKNTPISPSEIVEQTHEAFELGITSVHLHARLHNEKPTFEKDVYRKIIEGVRKHCPKLIICCSTSGRDFPSFNQRSEVIELSPDMCSLTLSSLNFIKSASINAPDMIQSLLEKMIRFGVNPELECFDLGMINYGKYLLKKMNITSPSYWNIIFGNIAGIQPTFSQIGAAISQVPEDHFISLGGIGEYQLMTNSLAITSGLGVRVGLEDNIWYDKNKQIKASNIMLLKRIHQLIEINQKELMSSTELGLYNKKNERK